MHHTVMMELFLLPVYKKGKASTQKHWFPSSNAETAITI
jgi:hypothetical protein